MTVCGTVILLPLGTDFASDRTSLPRCVVEGTLCYDVVALTCGHCG
jgi:hypothetical protein